MEAKILKWILMLVALAAFSVLSVVPLKDQARAVVGLVIYAAGFFGGMSAALEARHE